MADVEKAIKDLEFCVNGHFKVELSLATKILSLLKEQEHKDRMFHALEDDWKRLKELLKEQEAVEPYHVNTNHEQHWKCGNCNAVISLQDKYCSACGKPILWEGR